MGGFDDHRGLLFSIAYRMLGSVQDAEDMVQETYLRWQRADRSSVESPKDYLASIVTRLCIDYLRSARVKREEYIGPWLPEPLQTPPDLVPRSAMLAESLSIAFLVLLETLSPTERAVYLLRQVFDYSYGEIARIVDRSEAACRQIVSRARRRIAENRPSLDLDRSAYAGVVDRFVDAFNSGDVTTLVNLLAEDVTMMADGGGEVSAGTRPVVGRDAVLRYLLGVRRFHTDEMVDRIRLINGLPALVVYDTEKPVAVFTVEMIGGQINTVRVLLNPHKLASLPPLSHDSAQLWRE